MTMTYRVTCSRLMRMPFRLLLYINLLVPVAHMLTKRAKMWYNNSVRNEP
jgi:hypothetical protein